MSEIKALDKLREIADRLDDAAARMSEHGFSPIGIKAGIIADEIEREIQERYLLLPVDADGVPIHVGDKLDWCGKKIIVRGVCKDSVWFEPDSNDQEWRCIWANTCRHVKPRTLEDVLTDFVLAVREDANLTNGVARNVDKYAAEIRELLGGDAE